VNELSNHSSDGEDEVTATCTFGRCDDYGAKYYSWLDSYPSDIIATLKGRHPLLLLVERFALYESCCPFHWSHEFLLEDGDKAHWKLERGMTVK